MSTLASSIIANARYALADDATRWTDPECLKWLSEAETLVVMLKPSANTVQADITLVAGSEQTLPAGSLGFVKPLNNLTGTTPGKVPAMMMAPAIDAAMPDWKAAKANATVEIVVVDPQAPKKLWVYPPQPATPTQKLSALHVAQPAAIAAVGSAITLADEYAPALTDYLLHRCFGKDIEVPESAARSAQALTSFGVKLGVSTGQVTAAQAARGAQ